MANIFPARYTARIEGDFVVFLIGMRINKLFLVNKWLPVARAMPPMLKELYANRDSGFLSAEFAFTWRGVAVIQYWRSFEHLHAYAHARDAHHLPAWAAFNRSVGTDGSVGIWHETYKISAAQYECVYANMPRWGLAKAGEQIEAMGRLNAAKDRMGNAEGSS